jgi:Fic family protein
MQFNREKPYNQLPLLPPKNDIETREILKKTISATRELAGMVSLCKQLPNEYILYNSISLKEAKDSSEVENIVQQTMSFMKLLLQIRLLLILALEKFCIIMKPYGKGWSK